MRKQKEKITIWKKDLQECGYETKSHGYDQGTDLKTTDRIHDSDADRESVSTIIQTLLGNDKCGYIGTNGVVGKTFKDTIANTTPECHLLYKYLFL